jgi:hypothetical protein
MQQTWLRTQGGVCTKEDNKHDQGHNRGCAQEKGMNMIRNIRNGNNHNQKHKRKQKPRSRAQWKEVGVCIRENDEHDQEKEHD